MFKPALPLMVCNCPVLCRTLVVPLMTVGPRCGAILNSEFSCCCGQFRFLLHNQQTSLLLDLHDFEKQDVSYFRAFGAALIDVPLQAKRDGEAFCCLRAFRWCKRDGGKMSLSQDSQTRGKLGKLHRMCSRECKDPHPLGRTRLLCHAIM